MNLSLVDILAAQGRRGLGSLIVVPAIGGSFADSVSPFIKRQRETRFFVPRSIIVAHATSTRLRVESFMRVALRPGAGGSGLRSLGTPSDEVEQALTAARQAAIDADVAASHLTQEELDEITNQAAYKTWGEAAGRLGLPLSLGDFSANAAYTAFRSSLPDDTASSIGNWLARTPNPVQAAGTQLAYYERMAHDYIGGHFDQLITIGRSFRSAYEHVGGSVLTLASSFTQSVEAGGMGLVQSVMREKPDWLTPELASNAWGMLQRAIAAGRAGDVGGIVGALGSGVMSVASATGPAAPYVALAGEAMSIGGYLLTLFGLSTAPPPPQPFRISGEQWGTFKLLYSANVEGAAPTPIQHLASEGMSVFADATTGEVMCRPYPGWTEAGSMRSASWPHAMRAVDMFDRHALIDNDRVKDWVKTGRGITFDGTEDTPASLWSKVAAQDPFVKFAGAMGTSPVPYATGGGPGGNVWPVGPGIRYIDGIWKTAEYRGAYVAAAALGGCPPFASYGVYDTRAASYWFSLYRFCTGVGGRTDTSTPGRDFTWFIPWASTVDTDGTIFLTPPRRVPYHLQGAKGGSYRTAIGCEFRDWLEQGRVIPAHVNLAMDPEYLRWGSAAGGGSAGPSTTPTVLIGNDDGVRLGMTGDLGNYALTLAEFFRDWYNKPYDENEPRTWFVRGTPAVGSGFSVLRPSVTSLTAMQKAAADAAKWSTGTKVVVGAAVVGVPTGLYFLGRALRWWK